MRLVSIQVGEVRTHISPSGETWTSGYVKSPVLGPVAVGSTSISGDAQHNKKVHGGAHRAILAYSAEHYERWQQELAVALPYGSFGENFTISGLDEDSVCLGDIYAVGDTVRVQVSQPRKPCNQIYLHLQIEGIQQRVDETLRTGWYMRVLQTGEVVAGMTVTLVDRPHPEWPIMRVHQAYDHRRTDPATALALAEVEALEPGWRQRLMKSTS